MVLVLALTFARGIVYLVVVPPWQHYDEPTHFEYVRLIAETGRLPDTDELDLTLRRQIASSMQAADFWKGTAPLPIEFWSDEPAWLGVSELDHPPLYYAVTAIPQLLAAHQAVETQLYLARFVSLFLNLLVVASAFLVAAELFPQRLWLPFVVAAFVAWLPPLTDLMSAVTNDAGSAAAGSLLLLTSVRLIRRGPSLKRVGAVVILAAICIAVKNTSGIVAAAIILALVVSYVPRTHRRLLWIGLGILIPLGLVLSVTWQSHAAHWYSTSPPAAANHVEASTPLGHSALILSVQDDHYTSRVVQELHRSQVAGLREKTVTIGAWLKVAEGSAGLVTLYLDDGLHCEYHRVNATDQWQFHAFRAAVGPQATGVAVYAFIPRREGAAQSLYLDGLILAEGNLPLDARPDFTDAQATAAHWGEGLVSNLLQNGSAEKTWPGLRPWLGNWDVFGHPLAAMFQSLLDWSRTRWVYPPETRALVNSYWGTFGWNHLALPESILTSLQVASGLAALGLAVKLVGWLRAGRSAESRQQRAWLVAGTALTVSWVGAFLRVHPVFTTQRIIWPAARYTAAATVPSAIVVCLGLATIVPVRWRRAAGWLGLLCMSLLDAVALLTVIVAHYYG